MDPSGSKRKGNLLPVTSLKRQKGQEANYKNCLFCGGKGDLRNSSDEGKNRIIEAARERQRFNDIASSSIINRILPERGQDIPQFKYHHKCYSNFTDKGKLERLRKKHESTTKLTVGETSTGKQQAKPSRRSSREHAIDWNLCMFCQDKNVKSTHNVSTMELSRKIIGLAQSDFIMRVRLSNISDLVASEGKYHLKCWVNFQRKMTQASKLDIQDPCLEKLCSNIVTGLAEGHVYDMGCVWSQYVKSWSMENVDVPQKYQSRKGTS